MADVMQPTTSDQPSLSIEDRARDLGIDLGLIDENLRLTPLERLRQHDRYVRQILALQERLGVINSDDS